MENNGTIPITSNNISSNEFEILNTLLKNSLSKVESEILNVLLIVCCFILIVVLSLKKVIYRLCEDYQQSDCYTCVATSSSTSRPPNTSSNIDSNTTLIDTTRSNRPANINPNNDVN